MMINIETVKFVKMLDELAELMEGGLLEFGEATQTNRKDKLFYDEETRDGEGNCSIVLDSRVLDDPGCWHHDIVSYYEDYMDAEYTVRAVLNDKYADTPYVKVQVNGSDELIVVEPGHWYFT